MVGDRDSKYPWIVPTVHDLFRYGQRSGRIPQDADFDSEIIKLRSIETKVPNLKETHTYSQLRHDDEEWSAEEKLEAAAPLRIDVARGANLVAPPTMSDRDVVHSAGVNAVAIDVAATITPGLDRHGRIHT